MAPHQQDFRLRSTSPAIDSGEMSQAAQTEADGQLRPLDGNGDGRQIVDRGAYEYQLRTGAK